MKCPPRLLVLCAGLAAAVPAPAGLPLFGRPKGSPWSEDKDVAQRLFEQGRLAAVRGDSAKAIDKFEMVRTKCARTPQAGWANYELGCLRERSGDAVGAWRAYQEVVDTYPDSGRFADAVAAQVRVSEQLVDTLERHERGLAPKKDLQKLSRDEIMGMLLVALRNARTADGTPEAAYRLAVLLQRFGRPDEARTELESLRLHHPNHRLAAEAGFRIAMIDWQQAQRKNATDADRERAIESLEDFIALHADSELLPEAKHRLASCRGAMLRSLLVQAIAWEDKQKPEAARVCYRLIGTRYADLISGRAALEQRVAEAMAPGPAEAVAEVAAAHREPDPDDSPTVLPFAPRRPVNPLDPVIREEAPPVPQAAAPQ